MACQIEQRRADRARGANDEDNCSTRQATVAGEHLVGREISQRDAHGLGWIDAFGDRHEKASGTDGILCVSTDDTEISNQLSGELGRYAGSGLLDDADNLITRGERQWPLKVRIAAAPDEAIGKAGA